MQNPLGAADIDVAAPAVRETPMASHARIVLRHALEMSRDATTRGMALQGLREASALAIDERGESVMPEQSASPPSFVRYSAARQHRRLKTRSRYRVGSLKRASPIP